MFRPLLAVCATLLCSLVSYAQTSPPSLTILLSFDNPGSAVSQQAMRSEIQHLLGNSFRIEFGSVANWLGSTSGRLLIFNMRGHCSMEQPLAEQPRGLALGSTVVSEGSILPFGRIECDRIRASIQTLGHETRHEGQQQLGQAMGRVMVHEICHMLSGSPVHTKNGLTKRGLSPLELTANAASLPRESANAIEMRELNHRDEISLVSTVEMDHR